MSNTSAVLPLFCADDLAPLREVLRTGTRVAAGVAQMAGFAMVVWLVLAGPGFMADDPPPARAAHANHR